MQSWIHTNIRLGDVLSKVVDNRGKTPKWGKDGYDLIETTSIVGNNKYPDFSLITKRVSRNTFETWFRSGHPIKGDILIATVGANIGNISIMKETRGCIAQNLVALRPNKEIIDPDFLYYFLSWNRTQRILRNLDIGAAQPSIKVPHLLEFKIPTPPLPIQRRIAAILSAYDDLIENNTRRIQILEEMAQRIYEEWFVRFRFPGHENVTMVESEVGLIPLGWDVVPFTEIASVLSGGTPKTTELSYWDGDVPFFTPKDISGSFFVVETEKHLTESGVRNCNSRLYDEKTIFITARGTVGKVALPAVPMAMNQSCYALTGKKGINHHFLFMATMALSAQLKKKASGATFDAIVVDTFRSQPIVKPRLDLIDMFSRTVEPMFNEILNLLKRNEVLRKTRDLLLPKLISAEINVSNFPEPVSD